MNVPKIISMLFFQISYDDEGQDYIDYVLDNEDGAGNDEEE